MPDSFFQKKRKRSARGTGAVGKRDAAAAASSSREGPSKRTAGSRRGNNHRLLVARPGDEEESDARADFDDDDDSRHRFNHDVAADEERDAAETPAEARVRMAKMYLEGLKSDKVEDADVLDAAAIDAGNIARRLQKDVSESLGKIHIFVASRLAPLPVDGSRSLLLYGGHRASLTAAVASNDGRWVYTAAKDGNVFRWRLQDGRIDVLLPRAQRNGKAGSKQRFTTGGINAFEDDVDGVENILPAAYSKNAAFNANTDALPMSKSSGASRRKARREAALAAGQVSKGKAKAGYGMNHRHHPIVDLDQGEGHISEVWSLALTSDGRFLATGGADRRIGVWSCGELDATNANSGMLAATTLPSWVKALTGHKDSISGLKFRSGSHELYSASLDRTIKLFDIDQLSYVETLFGHQESILSLDALHAELAVSVGGRDRSARWWKIRDDSQLVFRGGAKSKLRDVMEGGHLLGAAESQGRKIRGDRGGSIIEGSLDCVAMVDDSHFLTGGDSGAISLWSLSKKKPVYTRAATHGFQKGGSNQDGEDGGVLIPRWITSLACLPYGDIFASGSWDGRIRLWSLDLQLRSFKPLTTIAAPGFVNSLQLFQPPRSSLSQPCVTPEAYRFRLRPTSNADADLNGTPYESVPGEAAAADSGAFLGRKESVPPILIAALGQEPRMARWIKDNSVRSGALVVPLSFKP